MREFIQVLTKKIDASNVQLDANEIGTALQGMQNMKKECAEVRALFDIGTHSLTHLLTHSLTHSPTHSLTHSLTHLLTHLLTHAVLKYVKSN